MALVVSGTLSTQVGAALAVLLLPYVGPLGVVTLRLGLSAAVLLGGCRGRGVKGLDGAQRRLVLLFGVVLVVMNVAFYVSVSRLPIGVVTALSALGPLGLTVVLARRLQGVLWAGTALCGIVLLGGLSGSGLDAIGLGCALLAGLSWALYIVTGTRVGHQAPGVAGLALAMAVAAATVLPAAVLAGAPDISSPYVLLLALSVALLGCALPYALELAAMRRVAAAAFGVLTSLSPAIAVAVGWLLLDQRLSGADLLGIALVVLASAGATVGLGRQAASAVPA